MSNVPTSTGLPITWQWCKRHDWKHEKVICPFCRAEKAERERDEARKALRLLADEVDVGRRDCQCGDLNCQHVAMTDGLLAAIYECCIAARAAAGEKKR